MSECVGIFWDYSKSDVFERRIQTLGLRSAGSCPTNKDVSDIALSLREECTEHGKVILFKAYFGLPGSVQNIQTSTDVRSELEEVGVTAVDNPKIGFGTLAADIFCFVLDQYESRMTTIVFVSGNPSVADLVFGLRARGVQVGTISPPGQLYKLSLQADWAANGDNYDLVLGSTGFMSHQTAAPVSSALPSESPKVTYVVPTTRIREPPKTILLLEG